MKLQALYNVRWNLVKRTLFGWFAMFDQLGYRPSPGDTVAASGIGFLLVCERFNVDPREVLNTCDRIVRRQDTINPEFPRAIRMFLKEEMNDD